MKTIEQIDAEIAELKTRADEIKELLFDAAAKVVAYEYLFRNKSKRLLPFPMPSAQAAEFRSRVDALLDGEEPIAVR